MTFPSQSRPAASVSAAGGASQSPCRRGSIGRRVGSSLCAAALLMLAVNAPLFGGQAPASPQSAGATSSQSTEHEDLAKKLQNPFANLITFPLQNITFLDIGPDGSTANVLNLQPVFPVSLNEHWNVLLRPILPVSYAAEPDSEFGLGDLNFEPFLSPAKAGAVEWGVGVIIGVPTATGNLLGTGKWTAGPSLAIFALRGHWAFSMIANQQWSYAGDRSRDRVSLLQLQPSLSYILSHGWFVLSGPLISADWTEPSGQAWTVPVGAGLGKVLSVGKRKMNLQFEAYANPIRPDDGPKSMILLTGTFLFPR
jgi:hypothetical protein